MRKFLLTSLLLALGTGEAIAGGFEAKTAREPKSVREVERPLLIQKNWLEFGLMVDWKNATGYWSPEGVAEDFEHASWTYSTQRLHMRYGIARRGELVWDIPFHYMHLVNDQLGTDTSTFGLGDPGVGYTFELLRNTAPLTSVVVKANIQVPAGNESPGSYIGGPYGVTDFITSQGTPDYSLALAGKRQFGPVALVADVGYVYRMSGVVQYLIETEQAQFSGRIKPGDVVYGDLELQIQAGPVAILGSALYQHRAATYIGTTGEELFGNNQLDEVVGSDGWSLDVDADVMVNVSKNLDIVGGVGLPIRGEDLQFFPIERIHPTRGTTIHGQLKFRY